MTTRKDNKVYRDIVRKMGSFRTPHMRNELDSMIESGEISTVSNMELLERLVDAEIEGRKATNAMKLKKKAHLQQPQAVLEYLDQDPERDLPMGKINQLATNSYIDNHRNVVVMGACGTGKSYLVNALANCACDQEYSVAYFGQYDFLQTAYANTDEYGFLTEEWKKKLLKLDLIIIDDFLISGTVSNTDVQILFQFTELIQHKVSLMIGTQMDYSEWHIFLGGNQMADSIVDRVKNPAVKIVLRGESQRKSKA